MGTTGLPLYLMTPVDFRRNQERVPPKIMDKLDVEVAQTCPNKKFMALLDKRAGQT